MEKTLITQEEGWIFQLSYQVPQSSQFVWQTLATNRGLKSWFEELSIANGQLIFQIDDFREEMAIRDFEPLKQFAFDWAGAQVSFSLTALDKESCRLDFVEVMPRTFPHPLRDLTGWAVQNERLATYFREGYLPDKTGIKDKWQAYLADQLDID